MAETQRAPEPTTQQDIADEAFDRLLSTLGYTRDVLVKHLTPDQLDQLMAESLELAGAITRERAGRLAH
jgi:hypothetical protein